MTGARGQLDNERNITAFDVLSFISRDGVDLYSKASHLWSEL